jgi:hypothetical protein
MKKIFVFLLICSVLFFVPSCSSAYRHKEDKVHTSWSDLSLYEIKLLYEAAGEGEEAFDAKVDELNVTSKYTRDQFLTTYEQFKDQVIVVCNSKRFDQYEFDFSYEGTKIAVVGAPSKTTSVDMVQQSFVHFDSTYGSFHFCGSSQMDPIHVEEFEDWQENLGLYATDAGVKRPYIEKDGYTIDAYYNFDPQTDISPFMIYLLVYRDTGEYVGYFYCQTSSTDPDSHANWRDFESFEYMTLEGAIQSAQPPTSKE